MRNKILIFFTFFLISLLAISSVSASEDLDFSNDLATDDVVDELDSVNDINDLEVDVGEKTTIIDKLQSNNIQTNPLEAKANDISIPTTTIDVIGEYGMQENITITILKNSTRKSSGNITFNGRITSHYNYISLEEGYNSIVLRNAYIKNGTNEISYTDNNGTWYGKVIINITPPPIIKNETHFETQSKTIYNNGDMVYVGTLKDSNNNPLSHNVFVKINSEYLFVYNENDYYDYGCDCYIDSRDGKIYVSNNCFNIGKNTVTLEFEEDDNYNSSNQTITITKMDKLSIKASNYNSFYTSKKKLKITANKKVKMKIVFKNKKTKKTKTYYVTGTTNFKIPVGCGKYSVTITSANQYYTSNKRVINVTVNKYTTFKHGKYKIKVHYKKMKSIQNAYLKQLEDWRGVSKKIKGKYYVWKQPIYKTVKVKKSKYVYKYVKYSEGYFYDDGDEYEYFKVKAPKGYKYCGTYTKWNKDYTHVINYYKFKKKTTYYTTKQVVSKYKKRKEPVYKTVEYDGRAGSCYFSIGNFYKDYYIKNINKYFKV